MVSPRARAGLVSLLAGGILCAGTGGAASASVPPAPSSVVKPPTVITLKGVDTSAPDRLDKVRVLKQGDPAADHVLVLAPGTSAGAAYFRPLGAAIVKALPAWQVWSVERRENLLEDHSMLDRGLAGKRTPQQVFDYYLGWITDKRITNHFVPVSDADAAYAREWGMGVAVGDLHRVVRAANRGGRTVVLGGHSLGGSITTAYATWDFKGKAGADDLDGLVFIDGAAGRTPPTAEEAQKTVDGLRTKSPFLDLGFGLPWAAGVFNALGSSAVLIAPHQRSVAEDFPLLPATLKPPVSADNRGQYGYALDTETGPANLALVQMHLGHLAESGDPRDWTDGELVPVKRAAKVFAGFQGMDGSSWYHPVRLSVDSAGIDNGIDNPAQAVFGTQAIHGDDVHIPMYAFETSLGKGRVLTSVSALAAQSQVPKRDVVLLDRSTTYAHLDPIAASPRKNAFLRHLVPFLRKTVG